MTLFSAPERRGLLPITTGYHHYYHPYYHHYYHPVLSAVLPLVLLARIITAFLVVTATAHAVSAASALMTLGRSDMRW